MNKEKLNDCLYVLRCYYALYEDRDEEISECIKNVFGNYKTILKLDKIPKKHVNQVSKFLNIINTEDKNDILEQAKKILV